MKRRISKFNKKATEQFKNVNVGSNGKGYFKHKSGKIFNGNQYVTTIPANVKYSGIIKKRNFTGWSSSFWSHEICF